jgi:hypothetical protein
MVDLSIGSIEPGATDGHDGSHEFLAHHALLGGQGAAVMSFETLGSHGDIHGEHHRKTIGKW